MSKLKSVFQLVAENTKKNVAKFFQLLVENKNLNFPCLVTV